MKSTIAIIAILTGLLLTGFTNINNPLQDKAPVRIYLEHFKNEEIQQLSVRVLAKTDKRYRPAAGVEVTLYTDEIAETNRLGTIVTASNGTGTYTFTEDQFSKANESRINNYFAVVQGTESLKSKEISITVEAVNLQVRYLIEDSVKQIHVHVSEVDSIGNAIPQEDVEIKFLVVRPLSPLPIGDEYNTTDEEGNVSMEFPDDLPGNREGYLTILVRIVENEKYGSVEVSEVKQWGVPTFVNDKTIERSLWASGANAPIPLLLFIVTLIIAVWGTIFYIVYKIFEIRKIGT